LDSPRRLDPNPDSVDKERKALVQVVIILLLPPSNPREAVLEEIVFQLGANIAIKPSPGYVSGWIHQKDWIQIRIQWTRKSSCSYLQILDAVLEDIVLELGPECCNKTSTRIRT
jgi:hypothetical protein